MANGELTEEVLGEIASMNSAAVNLESKMNVLKEIQAYSARVVESEIESSSIVLFEGLDAKLKELVEDTRPHVEHLSGVLSATDAIERGQESIDAWRNMTTALSAYSEIRAAQDVLMSNFAHDHRARCKPGIADLPAAASDAIMSNLDELWPGWRGTDPATGRPISRDMISRNRLSPTPWPDEPVSQLAWLLEHGTLWVPTKEQLDELWKERRQRDFEVAQELKRSPEQRTKRAQMPGFWQSDPITGEPIIR
ncbi:hypothetical protein ABZU78_29315 [Rhodococcus erythropolis]|uniref:hypothetical protein n=1 Tax=Rhodococcus erythropolis TaxID=1833 RepID=UPI0033AD0B34